MEAALLVFGFVFLAELGDKSQLIALSFATRHRGRHVVTGLVLASVATQTLSVAAGGLIGAVVQGPRMSLLAGCAFLVFAALALRSARAPAAEDAEDAEEAPRLGGKGTVLAVAASIFLAEIGDKTMFVTMTLAAREGVVPTWVGSVTAMVSAGLLGIFLGRSMRGRIPDRALALAAAALFAVFGALLLVDAAQTW